MRIDFIASFQITLFHYFWWQNFDSCLHVEPLSKHFQQFWLQNWSSHSLHIFVCIFFVSSRWSCWNNKLSDLCLSENINTTIKRFVEACELCEKHFSFADDRQISNNFKRIKNIISQYVLLISMVDQGHSIFPEHTKHTI